MSNTSKGWAKKGSKFWMQITVHNTQYQKELNTLIGDKSIVWISPVAGPDFSFNEYSLNQKNEAISKIGFPIEENLWDFWPKRQPQWDGIAVSGDGKVLYLIEAKAHCSELRSKMRTNSKKSEEKIRTAILNAHKEYKSTGDIFYWTDKYYQLANRLVFLNKLNKMTFSKIERVELVLLNFVNDKTHISEEQELWEKHYKEVWKDMLGTETVPDNVKVIFFDCKNREEEYKKD